jgi:hypothetical protein
MVCYELRGGTQEIHLPDHILQPDPSQLVFELHRMEVCANPYFDPSSHRVLLADDRNIYEATGEAEVRTAPQSTRVAPRVGAAPGLPRGAPLVSGGRK